MSYLDAHRVAPRLFVGAAPRGPGRILGVDAVVLMAQEISVDQTWAPVVRHYPIDDAWLDPDEIRRVLHAARKISALRRDGRTVISLCAAGVNRSALAAATSLVLDGASARDAIRAIRARRRPRSGLTPLCNNRFVEFLVDYEQVLRRARGVSVGSTP